MTNDWSDRMTTLDAVRLWRRQEEEQFARRLDRIEQDIASRLDRSVSRPSEIRGIDTAMTAFLRLRTKLFPDLPADPVLSILLSITRHPEGDPRNRTTGVTSGSGYPQATALRYIAAMEAKGIIRRVPDPEDKRAMLVLLTPLGHEYLDKMRASWCEIGFTIMICAPLLMVVVNLL